MIKILLIEDEKDKRDAIAKQVRQCVDDELMLRECESLRGGLKAIVGGERYDLILLDMSMPGFDPLDGEGSSNEEPESFAGREILAQMKLRNIFMPVVVVTQYKAFAKGTIGLEELIEQCAVEFKGIFIGAIYYSTAVESWKRELSDVIEGIHKC